MACRRSARPVYRFSADGAARCQGCEGVSEASPRDRSPVSAPDHTDKAHSYAKVIDEINDRLGPEHTIRHVDNKYLNNRIESDLAAIKQRLRPMRGFQTMAGAKAALSGIETFRTIRMGQFESCRPELKTRSISSPNSSRKPLEDRSSCFYRAEAALMQRTPSRSLFLTDIVSDEILYTRNIFHTCEKRSVLQEG